MTSLLRTLPLSVLLALAACAPDAPPAARDERAAPAQPPIEAPRPAAPAPRTPPAPPALQVPAGEPTAADRQAWRRALRWSDECEAAFTPGDPATGGLAFHPLGAGRTLVQVDCGWAAYQGSQVYGLYDETRQPPAAELLTFDVPTSPDGKRLTRTPTAELWGAPSFDPASRTLTVFSKSRGPGDCGILATYGFEEGKPALRKLRAKLTCDGRLADEPERWDEVPLP